MPKFHMEIPHSLPADEAKSRLERFIELERALHSDKLSDLTETWDGNTLHFGFKTLGFKIAGAIASLENKLDIKGDLPFAAIMFKGRIEDEIRRRLSHVLRS